MIFFNCTLQPDNYDPHLNPVLLSPSLNPLVKDPFFTMDRLSTAAGQSCQCKQQLGIYFLSQETLLNIARGNRASFPYYFPHFRLPKDLLPRSTRNTKTGGGRGGGGSSPLTSWRADRNQCAVGTKETDRQLHQSVDLDPPQYLRIDSVWNTSR